MGRKRTSQMETLLLNRDVCDQLNAQQIDELLQAKQIKAEEYASQPEIFLLHSFELEMQSTHGKCSVLYDNGEWSCTCDFFGEWETCEHVRAAAILLKDAL